MAYHRFINAIMQGQPIEIFGDGSQIRTNTYIDDCVLATTLAVKAGPLNDCINISGDDKVTLSGAISEIEERLSLSAIVRYSDSRIGDQFETSTSIQKARELLGYTPRWSYKLGISEQIQWHKFMNKL
jgi:nucleoside-diphosphate-sugar epimerase